MKTKPVTSTIPSRTSSRNQGVGATSGRRLFGLLAVLLSLALMPSTWAANLFWEGPSNTGDSGAWETGSNWDSGSIPTSSDDAYFDYRDSYTSQNATVTIGNGVSAVTANTAVRYGKNLTLHFEPGSSLTAAYLIVGQYNFASSLLMTGPATGSATANIGRIYMNNSGSPFRDQLTVSGANLTINLDGSYSAIYNRSTLLITNGATVNSTSSDGFYTEAGKAGNSYNNRFQILDGAVTAKYIENSGLTQLAATGTLAASSGTMELRTINGGRFEAEGSGLASTANLHIYHSSTLAVGLSDVDTGDRSAAATLNLASTVTLEEDSLIEMRLFGSGSGEADQIVLGAGSSLANVGTGTKLQLIVDGYTLHQGDSWTLFSGATTNISGNFNTSLIDTNIWNISDLNEVGGWKVVSLVPEPGVASLFLVGLVGLGTLLLCRSKKHSLR